MKKILLILLLATTLGCESFDDVVDFTSVENPNLSESSVVGQPNSSRIWLTGLERELSFAYNEILVLSELGSDNYVNTETFFSQFLDGLDIRTTDPDIRDTQYRVARLRESAQFGLETVGPGDPNYTESTQAEYLFFEGMSYLLSGMYFSGLPQEELGMVISSEDNYASAIASFEAAIALMEKPEYHLAKARANYYLGNKLEAVSAANSALALDPNFAREAMYDANDGPVNLFENALYGRSTFDDLQPLPTLDFLDPKYSRLTEETDPSVYYLKAEEAHLILAEANITDGSTSDAQDNLRDLLDLIDNREVRNIDDSVEGRTEDDPGSRPDNSTVVVNGRPGLVLDRQVGKVDVPSISGTSLTESEISSISSEDEGLELIYRTRQEVFIAEGLRFVDMGIKLVIHENEILQNENINDGDPSTIAVVPPFISSVVDDLDAITYDVEAGTASTVINVTEILVNNKTSEFVLPFN